MDLQLDHISIDPHIHQNVGIAAHSAPLEPVPDAFDDEVLPSAAEADRAQGRVPVKGLAAEAFQNPQHGPDLPACLGDDA